MLALPLLSLLSPGCVSYENMVLLQDTKVQKDSVYNYGIFPTDIYRIRPYDQLVINLNSYQESTLQFINSGAGGGMGGGGGRLDPAMLYISSYVVDEYGNIVLPLIGKLKVAGHTTGEIRDTIDLKLKPYLNYVSTSVKFTSFRVTLLGEVKTPGVQYIFNTKTTILQLLASANDLTEYADISRVKFYRERGNETVATYIDLRDPSLFNSEYYFLMPEDVIYIEPLKAKAANLNSRIAGVGLSAISTVVVIVNLFVSLNNNN
ncbi:MAG: polysaccharide biosynthesis/export family protein [Bacteroidia bacterium]